MRRFWQHDAEYCQLQGEMVIKTPLQFGPVILKPGDRITYMGDGRKHRSFEMDEGYSLQYCGYVLTESACKALLFTVPEQPQFKKYGIYYVFYHLTPNQEDNPPHKVRTLWLVRGPLGGGRDIILEEVRMATHEPIKREIYEQESLFNSF
ncbi:MAG: hypothetical protein JG764_965 [Clostridiales bacterium]|jgi:hypothetical protein|nr:hypothetical protein [Clostridiales bacterium]